MAEVRWTGSTMRRPTHAVKGVEETKLAFEMTPERPNRRVLPVAARPQPPHQPKGRQHEAT